MYNYSEVVCMDSFYTIFEKEEKFCPSYLEGILHTEFFEKDPFEAKESDFVSPWDVEAQLPQEFWFITKDRKYEFDYREYIGDGAGFFVSAEFLGLLQAFNIGNFQHQKLHVVNRHKKNVSSKHYYFVHFFNSLTNAIDMEKSEIELYKSGDAAGRIKKIWDLQLKDSIDFPDVFLLKNTRVSGKIFCSEKFKAEVERLNMKGILFVPSSQAGVYK